MKQKSSTSTMSVSGSASFVGLFTDLILGGQIAPMLKHTKAKELMHSLIEETTNYFDELKG